MDRISYHRATGGPAGWQLDDIPYPQTDRPAVVNDEWFFFVLTTASYIESASDLYTRNLIAYFAGDTEAVDWLGNVWEPEELRHGASLRRYVETVWADFDWQRGYEGFLQDYSAYCKVELLGPTPALEMASRCVVETGTAGYYDLLSSASPEPVIQQLTWHIRCDEVRHYSHFYRYFQKYRDRERPDRWALLKTLLGRASEVTSEDARCAYRNAYRVRFPERSYKDAYYRRFEKRVFSEARRHYPYEMAVKMFLRPLGLSRRSRRVIMPVAVQAMKLL
jgi:hypothetical protein